MFISVFISEFIWEAVDVMSSFNDRLRNDFPSPTPNTPPSPQPVTTSHERQREAVERMISTPPSRPSPSPSSPLSASLGSLPRRTRYFVSTLVDALVARVRPVLPPPPLDVFLCSMHIAQRSLVVGIAHAHRNRRAAETFRLGLSDGALSASAVTLHVERDGRTWTTTIRDDAALRLAVRTLNALPTPITCPRRQSTINFTLSRDDSRSDDDYDTISEDDADAKWCAAAVVSAHRMTNKTFRPPTPPTAIATTPALTTSPDPTPQPLRSSVDASSTMTAPSARFVVVSSDEERIYLRRLVANVTRVRRHRERDVALSLPPTPPSLPRRRRRVRLRSTREEDLTDDGDDFLIVKAPTPSTPPTQLTPPTPHNTSAPPPPSESSQIPRRRHCGRRTRIEAFSPVAAHFDISNAADAVATADDPIDNGRYE